MTVQVIAYKDGIDYEAMGYAFYKLGGGTSEVNNGFMLGFMLGLAEYPANYKTVKEAFLEHFSKERTAKFLQLAKEFRENQTEWVRWPSLALE